MQFYSVALHVNPQQKVVQKNTMRDTASIPE